MFEKKKKHFSDTKSWQVRRIVYITVIVDNMLA